MLWAEALNEVRTVKCNGAAVDVARVEYDSRRTGPGAVFLAMRGGSTDGNRYLEAAIAQGAIGIVTDSEEAYAKVVREFPGVAVALVEHGRRALAEMSSTVLGHPERKLCLSAVTGTNGKTTTAYLLEQMLRSVGRGTVLMGTIETRIGDEVRASAHTTPESRDTLQILAEGVSAGATEAVMEMSSHALEQDRVWGIPVDVAIFTNLTQDHLDYHGTMERYAAAKARLFGGVGAASPRVAVIKGDDAYSSFMIQAARESEVMTYSAVELGDYRAEHVRVRAGGTEFRFVTPMGAIEVQTPLTGRVNVENSLAAMCAALARGLTLEQIAGAARNLSAAPGRFQVAQGSALTGFTVVIDYAHTDDALRNLLTLARELLSGRGGRVITLFGCGGDRDRSKRPKMGRAAGDGSDLVVLTSDNPRSEDSMTIISEALTGVRQTGTECIVEPDRAAAIGIAIHSAVPGDIVLLAGKGHEKVQMLREGTVAFDDVAVAERVLRERETMTQAGKVAK